MRVNWRKGLDYDWKYPSDGPDIKPEDQATFHMRLISHMERVAIKDRLMSLNTETRALEFCLGTVQDMKMRSAVRGWENVLDVDGNPIPFSKDNLVSMLDEPEMEDLRRALLIEIDAKNGLAGEFEQNF